MPKRILFFSLTYYPFIGGAEVAIKETTDRISPKDYSFDMITLRLNSNLPKFERFGNIDIFRIGFGKKGAQISDAKKLPLSLNKIIYPFWAFLVAAILHKRKSYDAVCTVMTGYASFGALFLKIFFPKVPYILRADDGDPFEHYKRKSAVVGPLFKMLFTKADFALASSGYLTGEIRKMGYKGDAVIVPNGTNAAHFSKTYAESELEKLRGVLGKRKGDVFLITTSRLVKKNATDDVIRAMKNLPENISFLVFGIGPDLDMLKKLAKSEGVETRIKFLGQLNHADMPKYLKSSDIFIRPSRTEGFGISFIEAMAAGIPVIATQEGGIADFLFDAKRNPDKPTTGWAVDKDSPEQIAATVKEIIGNPDKVKRVVETARKMAFEKYDWNLIAKDMKEKVFDKVLK